MHRPILSSQINRTLLIIHNIGLNQTKLVDNMKLHIICLTLYKIKNLNIPGLDNKLKMSK